MNQRFYGKLSNVDLQGNGSNSVIRVNCATIAGSAQLTSVTDVSGYLGLSSIRVGMSLAIAGDFGGSVTVLGVVGDVITVDKLSTITSSNALARISPAVGSYHISASFYDPQSQRTVSDISGSINNPLAEKYAVLGQAATPIGTVIRGRFHKYAITEILRGSNQYSNFEGYISWDERKYTEEESGDTLYQGSSQILGIVSLTPSQSLGPIFADNIAGLVDLPPGTEVAAYQIDLDDFYDSVQASITGSVEFLSASYSGTQRIEFFTSSELPLTSSFFVDLTGSLIDDVHIVSGTMLRFSRLESGSFFDLDLADIDVTSSLHIKHTGSLITTSSMFLDFSRFFLVSESVSHATDKGLHIDLTGSLIDDVDIVSGTMLRFSRVDSGSFFDLDLADIDVTSSLHIKYTGSLVTTSSMFLDFSKYFLVSESFYSASDKGLHIDLDPKYFDIFPYTGSADISGSMHIDTDPSGKSPFLITIHSASLAEEVALEVNTDGVTILGNHTGSFPTPVSGGMIYSEGCYFFSIPS